MNKTRTIQLSFRATPEEAAAIRNAVATADSTMQSYLLAQALSQPITAKRSVMAEKSMFAAFLHVLNKSLLPVRAASNNLNQIAKKLNSGQVVAEESIASASAEIVRVLKEVDIACQSLKQ